MQQHDLISVLGLFDRLRFKMDAKPGDKVPIVLDYAGGPFDIHCFSVSCSCQDFKKETFENNACKISGTVAVDDAKTLLPYLAPGGTVVTLERDVTVYFETSQPFYTIGSNGQRYINGQKMEYLFKIVIDVDLSQEVEEKKKEDLEAKALQEAGVIKG